MRPGGARITSRGWFKFYEDLKLLWCMRAHVFHVTAVCLAECESPIRTVSHVQTIPFCRGGVGWAGPVHIVLCSLSVKSVTPDRLAGHRAWHGGSAVGPKARLGRATMLGGLDPTCQNSGGLEDISICGWTPPEPAPWICRSATFTFQLPAFSCVIYFPACHVFTLSDQPSFSWPSPTRLPPLRVGY